MHILKIEIAHSRECLTRTVGPLRRKRAVLEEQLIVEEVARRVKEEIEARVRAAMASDAVQQSLQARLEAERKQLEQQVCTHCPMSLMSQFLYAIMLGLLLCKAKAPHLMKSAGGI